MLGSIAGITVINTHYLGLFISLSFPDGSLQFTCSDNIEDSVSISGITRIIPVFADISSECTSDVFLLLPPSHLALHSSAYLNLMNSSSLEYPSVSFKICLRHTDDLIRIRNEPFRPIMFQVTLVNEIEALR